MGTKPRSNRFTPLADADSAQAVSRDDGEQEGPKAHWHTLALGGTLFVILAAIGWALWPESSDAIYRRIVRTVQERSVEDAKGDIDRFLARFPDDPRAAEVDDWRMDVECVWLQKRLALKVLKSGGSRLEPYERELLKALRLRDKDPEAARKGFAELLNQYPLDDSVPPQLRACLDAWRHQLRRLQTPPPP